MCIIQGVHCLYLISKEIWVLSACVGGFNLPGNSGRLLARQWEALGSQVGALRADLQRPLASPSPTPCPSGILQLVRFPARGVGQSSGEELTHLPLRLVLRQWLVEERLKSELGLAFIIPWIWEEHLRIPWGFWWDRRTEGSCLKKWPTWVSLAGRSIPWPDCWPSLRPMVDDSS